MFNGRVVVGMKPESVEVGMKIVEVDAGGVLMKVVVRVT